MAEAVRSQVHFGTRALIMLLVFGPCLVTKGQRSGWHQGGLSALGICQERVTTKEVQGAWPPAADAGSLSASQKAAKQ